MAGAHPTWSDEEICCSLSAMDVADLKEREQKKLQSLANYYTKNSKIKSSVCFKKLENGKAIYTIRKCSRRDSESYLSNLCFSKILFSYKNLSNKN